MNKFKKKKIKKRIKSYLENADLENLALLLETNKDEEIKDYFTSLIEEKKSYNLIASCESLYSKINYCITDENVKNNIKAMRLSMIYNYEEDDLVYELLTNKNIYNLSLEHNTFNKFRIMQTVNKDVFIKYLTECNTTNLEIVLERIANDSDLAKIIYDMKKENIKMTRVDDFILINSIFKDLNKNIINDEELMQKLIKEGTIENILSTYLYIKSYNMSFDKYGILNKLENKLREYINNLEESKNFKNLYKLAYILKQSNDNSTLVNDIVDIFIKNEAYDYIIKSSIYLDKTLLDNYENYEDLFIAIEFTKFSDEDKEEMKKNSVKDMSEKYFNNKYKDKDNETIRKSYNNRIKK